MKIVNQKTLKAEMDSSKLIMLLMEESTKHIWVNIPFALSQHILKMLLDLRMK